MPFTIPTSPTYYPPNGLDRAGSGLPGAPGTQTQAGNITFVNSAGQSFNLPANATFFEEKSNSPEIERAEQCTIVHTFDCDNTTAQTLLIAYGRGSLLMDSGGNITQILSTRWVRDKGGYSTIVMTSEAKSFDPPPDEFSIDIVELNPDLLKHPRYNFLTYKQKQTINNYNISYNTDLKTQFLQTVGSFTPILNATASLEALFKKSKGIDSFYLPGIRMAWSQYFFLPQFLNPGGYLENPITQGGLPYFFWSIDGTEDQGVGNTILGKVETISPQIFGQGQSNIDNPVSWLRQMDSVAYQRTWFRLTRTWIGGPLGQWDKELYTITNNPATTTPPTPAYGLPYQSTDSQS